MGIIGSMLLSVRAPWGPFKAYEAEFDRVVALKLINEQLADSSDYRARLSSEAKAAARIDSPHIVKVWEQSIFDNQPYISLEFVSGKTLRELMEDFDLNQKIDLACQMAKGLESAHSRNIIHKRIKPHINDIILIKRKRNPP